MPKAWDTKLAKAEKFFQKSVTHGRKVYARYEDERSEDITALKRCNIFYANVNTLKESLFNSMPKADVSRLHSGDWEDDASRVAALVLQRSLDYEVETTVSFTESVRSAILNRLVPGIGTAWVRFGVEYGEGDEPITGSEKLYLDTVYWEDFIYEPARCWTAVTWVARKIEMSKKEIGKKWGEEAVTQASMKSNSSDDLTPKEINEDKMCVYEIWDKKTKKVYTVLKGVKEILEEKDDPYNLPCFFPCPRPLIANATTAKFLPVTDYFISQDQYTQLDTLYARMNLITQAIKVAGCYDASSEAIGSMLEGQENKLIPVSNWAMYAESGGAKGMIDWYPVEVVANVYTQLQQQFTFIVGVLQQVSGMSDIVRGNTNQYETAKAQEIKAGFASVRMNGYQRDVSEFVSEILNIMSVLIVNLYSDEKLLQIIGTLSQPDMQLLPEAAQILRNNFLRGAKITIKADSLTQSDWALEKGQRMELTGYISQFLTSAVSAMQSNPSLSPTLIAMLKFTLMGYKGADELEGIIDQQLEEMLQKQQASKGQPPPPSPEEQKMQAEQQQAQAEQQMQQQQQQFEIQQGQAEAQAKLQEAQQKMQMEQQRFMMENERNRQKHDLEMAMMDEERQFKREEYQLRKEEMLLKFQVTKVTNEQKMEIEEEKHENDMKNSSKDIQ